MMEINFVEPLPIKQQALNVQHLGVTVVNFDDLENEWLFKPSLWKYMYQNANIIIAISDKYAIELLIQWVKIMISVKKMGLKLYDCDQSTELLMKAYHALKFDIPSICQKNRGSKCILLRHNNGGWCISSKHNSEYLCDVIWWRRSGPTFAQVMDCCLVAPGHYLNQCCLIIKAVLWHSPESNFIRKVHEFNLYHVFED